MFRNTLINKNFFENTYVYNKWGTKIKGLIKTPFFDEKDEENGYVVYYSEINQSYCITKYSIKTGEIIFEKKVTNGSYGTCSIYKDQIIAFKEFKDIVSFDKNSGKFLWEIKTNSRIRSSINVIDDQVVFSSGSNVYFVDELGKVIKKINVEKSFLFGTISKIGNLYFTIGTKFCEQENKSFVYICKLQLKMSNFF